MHPFLESAAREGALVSGGPIPQNFMKGWAHPPMSRGKMIAHHWRRGSAPPIDGVVMFESACGLSTVSMPAIPLLQAGNLPYCQRCENKLMKQQRAARGAVASSASGSPARQGARPDEQACNPLPDAPHGFNRNASHNAGRYVCDCEGWEPDEQKRSGDAQGDPL